MIAGIIFIAMTVGFPGAVINSYNSGITDIREAEIRFEAVYEFNEG